MPDPVWQAPSVPSQPDVWILALNRYQRDNLLLLLNAIGYPVGNRHADPDLAHWNTGEWSMVLGEVGCDKCGWHEKVTDFEIGTPG